MIMNFIYQNELRDSQIPVCRAGGGLFVNDAVQYEEMIFSSLVTAGVIKKENPHIMALRFYTPI